MHDYTLRAASEQPPYFRTVEFSAVNKRVSEKLKALLYAPDSARTVLLTASGSGAMEAAVINCFDSSDNLLVIDGGSFGKRFCEICDIHDLPYEVLNLDFGEALRPEMLSRYDRRGFTGLLANIHETSTGQLYSLELISSFCKRNGAVSIIDAISSFLADDFDFDLHDVGAVILSSQKALALSCGLSAVILSERMVDERIARINSGSLYFNFKEYLKNMERGQTPFTPAVTTLLEMDERLRHIRSADDEIRRTGEIARRFRRGASELGFSIPNYPLSNALTPLLFDGNAGEVYRKLKRVYNLELTPSGGALADTMLRVGHLGDMDVSDIDELLGALRSVI
jgi:aspartate aminotransferase-like enzyme